MRVFLELKRAAQALKPYDGQWAICGGVAASIYREKPRFTNDIDFALCDTPLLSAEELASRVVKDLGYAELKGFVPASHRGTGSSGTGQILGLICARTNPPEERFAGIDFILPVQFWVAESVRFAQQNRIDYGFAALPTITPESLILAKLAAFQSNPQRIVDLDDINELSKTCDLDLQFLQRQIDQNQLLIPAGSGLSALLSG